MKLRWVPAVIYKAPSVSVPRGMRSSSPLAWGNSDMEKSLSLIILRHKSHSPTPVLLTCVHFLLHNDQTQLQPAALRLYLSTHLGASGLCLLRYWKRHSLPSFSPSVTFICPLQFLFTSRLPFVPPSSHVHSNPDRSSNSSPLSAPPQKPQSPGKKLMVAKSLS